MHVGEHLHEAEWKLDVDYARWMQGHEVTGPESNTEASMEEAVPKVRRSLRSRSVKEDLNSDDEFHERVVSGLESCAMSLDTIRRGEVCGALDTFLVAIERGQALLQVQVKKLQRHLTEHQLETLSVLSAEGVPGGAEAHKGVSKGVHVPSS